MGWKYTLPKFELRDQKKAKAPIKNFNLNDFSIHMKSNYGGFTVRF